MTFAVQQPSSFSSATQWLHDVRPEFAHPVMLRYHSYFMYVIQEEP